MKESGLVDAPLLTTIRGYDVTAYPRRRGSDVYAELFRKGDYFTANSNFLAQRAIELGCPREKIVTLPTGINMARFQYVEREVDPDKGILSYDSPVARQILNRTLGEEVTIELPSRQMELKLVAVENAVVEERGQGAEGPRGQGEDGSSVVG